MLDYNPSQIVSAMWTVPMVILPLCLFVFLNYFRLKVDYAQGEISLGLWTFTQIMSPIEFVGIMYFYMVFVNHPDDVLGSHPNGGFLAHYIPFGVYQWSMNILAITQVWYLIEKEALPFGIGRGGAIFYIVLSTATLVFYTVFIVSFVVQEPILDTTDDSQRFFAQFIMFFYSFLGCVVPIFISYENSKNGFDNELTFTEPMIPNEKK